MWANEYHKKFLLLLIATTCLRVALGYFVPITGDEAYFVVWAKNLAGGYYDHPPAVSWLIAPTLPLFSGSALAARLSSILLIPLAITLVYDLIIRLGQSEKRAYITALIIALHPLFWLTFLITTDTPLYLSSIVLIYFLIRYIDTAKLTLLLVVVISMMVAIQSKYFAVLLFLSLFAATVLINKTQTWRLFIAVTIGAAISGMLHLWWNANNCYPTILFNFINRQQVNDHWPDTMINFWLMFLWILIPIFHKSTFSLFSKTDSAPNVKAASRALLAFWLLPFAVFLLVATGRLIGLHYVVPLVLFFLIWLGVSASEQNLASTLKISIWSSAVHFIVMVFILLAPISMWQSNKIYRGLVTHFHTSEILKEFEQPNSIVGAINYSIGSVLEFQDKNNRHWAVWGGGSFQARQDDFITDWKSLQGSNFEVFSYDPMAQDEFGKYFEKSSDHSFDIHGVTFHRWEGINFNYERYREEVILPNLIKNYKRPQWLPSLACPLEKNYGVTF
jgi:4-amino-4-deoxy-L-arabinose transferase-like glycosyltransferase